MSTAHLRLFLKDVSVTFVPDNAISHGNVPQRKARRKAKAPKRRTSDPGEIFMLSDRAGGHGGKRRPTKQECRWQSEPSAFKKASDMAPVLTRRVEGPMLSLASMQQAYRCQGPRDRPPTFIKRSIEKPLSLGEILNNIDVLSLNDGPLVNLNDDDFMDFELLLRCSSTHTP